jgi:AcrR family transcriptional regulator
MVCMYVPTLGHVNGTHSVATTDHPNDPPTDHPADPPAGPPAATRRELNKARTREAIVAALRDLLPAQPVHRITVDELASAAGVSRRTFFNYYAGIPAVVSEVIGASTAHLAEAIGELDPQSSPLRRLRELVAEVGLPADLVEWLALLNAHDTAGDPAADAFERTVWAEKGAWLEGVLTERLPDGLDPLYLATLGPTIMHCFAAAERTWAAGRSPQAPVDRAALDDFHRELDRALSYAERGWAAAVGRDDAPAAEKGL